MQLLVHLQQQTMRMQVLTLVAVPAVRLLQRQPQPHQQPIAAKVIV